MAYLSRDWLTVLRYHPLSRIGLEDCVSHTDVQPELKPPVVNLIALRIGMGHSVKKYLELDSEGESSTRNRSRWSQSTICLHRSHSVSRVLKLCFWPEGKRHPTCGLFIRLVRMSLPSTDDTFVALTRCRFLRCTESTGLSNGRFERWVVSTPGRRARQLGSTYRRSHIGLEF